MVTEYEMIPVKPDTKKRFKQLKDYKMTDDEFLNKLIAEYESERRQE